MFSNDKETTGRSGGIGSTARVKRALAALKKGANADTVSEMNDALCECILNGTWVNMITYGREAQGYRAEMRTAGNGEIYAAWYTGPDEIRTPKYSLMITDINKLLDMMYSNPGIAGMVINPDTEAIFLRKEHLLSILLHSQYSDQQLPNDPPRDWGKGIPGYSPDDLMTEGMLLNFAMEVILGFLQKEDYEIITTCDNPDVTANIIAQKEDDVCLIAVQGYCAEEEPDISPAKKSKMLEYKSRYHTKCFYAPVSFRSSDEARFNQCLALRGDGFFVRFSGLTEI